MAIERKHKGGGKRIDVVGDYRVKIVKTSSGMSKGGKPMLTVTFETDDEKQINGYYCRHLTFHMAALKDLKVACGLKDDAAADMLVGLRCGIAVGEQAPAEDGTIFMQVEGYDKESAVPGAPGEVSPKPSDMEVPF